MVVPLDEAGLELERGEKLGEGLALPAVARQRAAVGVVRLGVAGGEFQRLLEMGDGLGKTVGLGEPDGQLSCASA